MVYKIQKRPTELYLSPVTSEDINLKENRCKSPSRNSTKMVTPTRTNSVERKYKLMKKKSSKDKDQLMKGNVFEVKKDSNNNTNNNTCDCPKSTATKNKSNKSNKLWKNARLFDAVLDNDFKGVRDCLITDEMDVNEFSPEGTSVLHIASAAGFLDCLELLLECGAKVDSTDANNRTPLEYAVIYGNFECAALLIEHGADSKVIKNGIN